MIHMARVTIKIENRDGNYAWVTFGILSEVKLRQRINEVCWGGV